MSGTLGRTFSMARRRGRKRYLVGLTVLILAIGSAEPAASTPAGGALGLTSIAVVQGQVWVGDGDGFLSSFDARTGRRSKGVLRAGMYAFSLAAGFRSLWVASDDGVLRRIDTARRRVLREIGDSGRPTRVVVAEGAVWTIDSQSDRIVRISPGLNRVTGKTEVVGRAITLTGSQGGIWEMAAPRDWTGALRGPKTIRRIDPRTLKPVGPSIHVNCWGQMAAARTVLWVSNVCADTVSEFSAVTGRRVRPPIRVGREPLALAVGGGSLWVANHAAGTVTRIDTRSGRTVATIHAAAPYAIALGAGSVWVVSGTKRALTRIDPSTNRIIGAPIRVPRH